MSKAAGFWNAKKSVPLWILYHLIGDCLNIKFIERPQLPIPLTTVALSAGFQKEHITFNFNFQVSCEWEQQQDRSLWFSLQSDFQPQEMTASSSGGHVLCPVGSRLRPVGSRIQNNVIKIIQGGACHSGVLSQACWHCVLRFVCMSKNTQGSFVLPKKSSSVHA